MRVIEGRIAEAVNNIANNPLQRVHEQRFVTRDNQNPNNSSYVIANKRFLAQFPNSHRILMHIKIKDLLTKQTIPSIITRVVSMIQHN